MSVGKALLGSLIDASEKAGIWSLQAGIFKENAASITLHKDVGFREIGFQERKPWTVSGETYCSWSAEATS